MLPGTRAHGGSAGRRKKTRQNIFFKPEIRAYINASRFASRRTSVQDSSRLKFLSMHRSVRLHGSSSLYQQSPNFRVRSDLFAFIGNHRLFLSTFAFKGSNNHSPHASICSPACIDLFACMGARVYINNRPIFEHAPICSPS